MPILETGKCHCFLANMFFFNSFSSSEGQPKLDFPPVEVTLPRLYLLKRHQL